MTLSVQSASLRVVGRDAGESEVLFWDGRLDNRPELERALDLREPALGAPALIAAVYERWGTPGLKRVIGDWSLVLRDGRSGALVLASDFAGVRPLYYLRQAAQVCWSSRLDALVRATGSDAFDEAYIAAYLLAGGSPDRTPYAGIACVPPGHAVSIGERGTTIHRFWTAPLDDRIHYHDEREYDAHLRALFAEAVAVRLRTSAPVLAELSGGLDSSSVVCMADRLMRAGAVPASRLTTVSYLYGDSSDAPFIRDVEAFCDRERLHVSTDDYPLVAESCVGEAMPAAWTPLHGSVMRLARQQGATVFLTGQNGDLAMGNWFDDSHQVAALLRRGRLHHAAAEALAWSRVLRRPIAGILWRALLVSLPPAVSPRSLYALEGASPATPADTSIRRELLARSRVDSRRGGFEWMQAPPERRRHFASLAAMQELRTLQRPEALQDLDYTHPFAHRPLVEFAMSLPAQVLCRPGEPRRLMRRALGDLWPARLRGRRSKSLFTRPWADALRPLALGLLASPCWQVVERGWVDRDSLTTRLEKLTHGVPCHEAQLRQIILLEYWLRHRGLGQRFEDARKTA